MNYSVSDIFRIVGMLVIWGVALAVGITVLTTLVGAIIAFASTGVGAIILLIIGWRIYKSSIKQSE